jgi:hypothetical protein
LKKVAEAKEFVKAVKDDDAAVPKHLWLIGYVAHRGSQRLGEMLPWRGLGK